jgi:Polyketide cyclase / dehydrase and lipid transport
MSIFLAGCPIAFTAEESTNTGDDWKLSAREKDVAIYSRLHPGSPLKEFKAVGPIDAPTHAVCAVIDDFENYPKFMPYTTECRLIRRDGDSIVGYQRLSPKVCADRDYTLRVWKKSWPTVDGLVCTSHWSPANELGPPEKKGVVRVKICEGKWLLEPDGAIKTRATYSIYTDTGGFIPSFIANRISSTGITKLFAAVRKQVKDPKYAASTPGDARPLAGEPSNGKSDETRMTADEKSKKTE